MPQWGYKLLHWNILKILKILLKEQSTKEAVICVDLSLFKSCSLGVGLIGPQWGLKFLNRNENS